MSSTKLTIFFFLLSFAAFGQVEICNNALDDDNDGLIDLNDPDCDCPETVPSGLIPNPSFEGMTCCPTFEAQFECAVSWEQASAATSDYLHTCGTFTYPTWLGNSYQTPTPLPDGAGWVGFRDGNATGGNLRPNYKEYVGAKLNATMEIGKKYKIVFYLGFPNNTNFGGIDMTFYAHESDDVLPFGNGNSLIGCPLNTPGWTQLDQQYLEGLDEWIEVSAEFVADKAYNTFVLGPGCDEHPDWRDEPYYFVDRLALAEVNEFDVPFAEIIGDVCDEDLRLVAPANNNYTYQWYKNGIAIVGETNAEIDLEVDPAAEGIYVCVFGVGTTCIYSEEFNLVVPESDVEIEAAICEGEFYEGPAGPLTTTDIYEYFLFSTLGCDSMITIDLTVYESKEVDVPVELCEGESYPVEGDNLTTAGVYPYMLQTMRGCDSLVLVAISISPTYDSIITPRICQGEIFSIAGDDLVNTGTYPYDLQSKDGCDSTIEVRLIVLDATEMYPVEVICEGEVFPIAGEQLDSTAIYEFMLMSSIGCDSLIFLDLTVEPNTVGTATGRICDEEAFSFLGEEYSEAGTYEVLTQNTAGCDSLITLDLDVVNLAGGIVLEADTTISLGEEVTIVPSIIDPTLTSFEWTSSTNDVLIANGPEVTLTPLLATTLTVTGFDDFGCSTSDMISVRISRDIGIYPPNVFSPNGDNANDLWKISVSKSIASLDKLVLYDRWGNLIYVEESVSDVNNMVGWDGTMNGTPVAEGVYVYYASYTALDGISEQIVGDVTVMR